MPPTTPAGSGTPIRWSRATTPTAPPPNSALAGIDPYDASDHVIGDSWLDAHRAAQAEDDQHREIHPDDIANEHDDARTNVPEPRKPADP